MSERTPLAALVLATAIPASMVHAAPPGAPSIAVGPFASTRSCTVYQEAEGSSAYHADSAALAAASEDGAVAAARSSVSAYSSWRTWLVRDCVDHFESLRTSLQAALAASGNGPLVKAGGADLTVSGAISDVRTVSGTGFVAQGEGYGAGADKMAVSMDITVRDRQGRILFGAPINKSIDLSSNTYAGNISTGRQESGQGLYARLQQEIALAAARAVSFHFRPLAVTAINGKSVGLNYGAPYLQLGSTIQIIGNRGGVIKLAVTAAGDGTAVARVEGNGDLTQIAPGQVATFLDPEDPAANGRRFEKSELP